MRSTTNIIDLDSVDSRLQEDKKRLAQVPDNPEVAREWLKQHPEFFQRTEYKDGDLARKLLHYLIAEDLDDVQLVLVDQRPSQNDRGYVLTHHLQITKKGKQETNENGPPARLVPMIRAEFRELAGIGELVEDDPVYRGRVDVAFKGAHYSVEVYMKRGYSVGESALGLRKVS